MVATVLAAREVDAVGGFVWFTECDAWGKYGRGLKDSADDVKKDMFGEAEQQRSDELDDGVSMTVI